MNEQVTKYINCLLKKNKKSMAKTNIYKKSCSSVDVYHRKKQNFLVYSLRCQKRAQMIICYYNQAITSPRAAANRAKMELATIWEAPLAVVGVAALPKSEVVVDPAAAPEPEPLVPLGIAVSAPGVGAPKVETPDPIGPTGADAEAPTPTKNPTSCCMTKMKRNKYKKCRQIF
jgi:hypothetical protein